MLYSTNCTTPTADCALKTFVPTSSLKRKNVLARAIALTLLAGTVAIPASSLAATLTGDRLIDDSLYTARSYIVFKLLDNPALTQFTTPVVQGRYEVILPDGSYEVWQNANSAVLTGTQLDQVQWANTGNPDKVFKITVTGDNITWTESGLPVEGNKIDFPFPNLNKSTPIPSAATQECDVNATGEAVSPRSIICETGVSPPNELTCDHNYSAGEAWPGSDAFLFEEKRVFVYGKVAVSSYESDIATVTSLCNYGTLVSNGSDDIKIGFGVSGVFLNSENGKIIGADAPANSNQPAAASITLKSASTAVNLGMIQAGNAATHSVDSARAVIFVESESTAGNVTIEASNTYQYGDLLAGQGSNIRFTDCRAAWQWEHHAGNAVFDDQKTDVNLLTPSKNKAGKSLIKGASAILGDSSFSSGGIGGSIIIDNINSNDIYCWNVNEIEGGSGGNLEFSTLNVLANGSTTTTAGFTALKGNSVYVEPDTIEISGNTTITADEDVVIFGGDNYVLRMTNLREGAITAGRNIILAVGNGGTIDLRGISTKMFKAAGRIEVYTDNLILDRGVTLESLVSSGVVVRGGNKIIYHATFTGTQGTTGEADKTVPVQLTLHNGGPKVDTYTLSVTSRKGWTVSGLPATVTIDGLKQTELNLNVTLPAEGNDVITVTATSQADSTVVATTQIQASVEKPVVVEPEKVALTVSKVGEGSITAQGIDCGEDCTEDFALNTEVKLLATPAEGYEFANWSGDCATETLTMDTAKNCAANFKQVVIEPPPPPVVGKYTAHGTLRDKAGNALAGVTVQIGDKTTVTDGAGNWEIGELLEGTYEVIAAKDGFACLTSDVELGNQQYLQAVNCEPVTSLKAKLTNQQWGAIPQGQNLSYTVTLFNGGETTATGIKLAGKFPEGVTIAKFEGDTAACDPVTAKCTVADLAPGTTATLSLELSNLPPNGQAFMNALELISNEYPADVVKSWRKVKPYLSLLGKAIPNPVVMGGKIHYALAAELLNTAPELTAKAVKAEIRLPNELKFLQATTAQGTCENVGNTVTCNLGDLSVENSDSISRVDIRIDAELGQDLVQLNAETKMTASNYPEHHEIVAVNTILGDGKVDGIILLDVTASMGEELQAVINAVKAKLNQQFENAAQPVIALVTFRDSVKIEVISDDLTTLLKALEKLEAKDGGTCPEASAQALDLALDHIKPNGMIIFVTDAPPYEGTDIEALQAKIVEKQANFVPIVTTSDCATNQLSSPQQ